MGLGLEAYASTHVIPSPLRTARGTHSTGAAAAWSDRNRLNTELLIGTAETEQGSTVTEEEDTTAVGVNVFKRTASGTVLEGRFSNTLVDEEDPTVPSTTETSSNLLEFILGLPITENFVIGAEIQRTDTDFEYSSAADAFYEQQNVEVSAGFKTGDMYYMGAIRLEDIDDDGTTDDDEVLLLGVGVVKDRFSGELYLDYENEEGTKEYLFSALGTINTEKLQHIIQFFYLRNINPNSYKLYRAYYGLDINLGPVYLLPSFAYTTSDSRSFKDSIPSLAMEVGHRGDTVGLQV